MAGSGSAEALGIGTNGAGARRPQARHKRPLSGADEDLPMDALRLGLAFRALRRELGLRQADVAERAGVSQQHVSDLERGHIGGMAVREIERLFEVLGARAAITVLWRGAQLDRLLDEGHADICRRVADLLRSSGWQVVAEATYSIYGERGSIDILAWHPQTRTLLVVEVKTEIASAEETLRRHDAKVRLASQIGRERFGMAPLHVGRLLVIAGTMTNRRRVQRLAGLLSGTYPLRGPVIRAWLRAPNGPAGGLLFSGTARPGARVMGRRRPRTIRLADTSRPGARGA